jgi:hypothetical protein
MDLSTIAKYAAGAALLASVYVLVWFKLVDAGLYMQLVVTALSTLGVHAVVAANK